MPKPSHGSAKRRAKASVEAVVVVMAAEVAEVAEVAVMAAVAAPVAHAVAAVEEAAVIEVAVAVAAVEAGIAEHQAELQGLYAHPSEHLGSALRLNSKALFILNTHPKIQKLRNSHGYRTYSLHHQA